MAIWGIVFIYEHPYAPVVLPNASSCQLYRIETLADLKHKWLSRHPFNPMTAAPPTYPDFNSAAFGPKLDVDYWVAQGPVSCSPAVLQSLTERLASRLTYHRFVDFKSRYHPTYAYRLSGAAGSELVLIDISAGWIQVRQYDNVGALVARTGLFQGDSGWLDLLRQTLPTDTAINNVWRANQAGLKQVGGSFWHRLHEGPF
jgi:hypothetical protein